MISETSLHRAIEELGTHVQVPLVAEPLSQNTQQLAGLPGSTASGDLYVRLGVPLAVSVETGRNGILVRGDLEKMNWSLYEEVSGGIRKVVAASLGVDFESLALNKLMVVDESHATQYFEIVVPSGHGQSLTSDGTQANIATYLQVVKGERLPEEPRHTDALARSPVTGEESGDDARHQERCRSLAIDLAREVRAAVGGKTLPAACTIDAPGWSSPMELSGKLGEKIRTPPSAPEKRVIECYIDGYLKSQRVVHLLPVSSGSDESVGAKRDGRKIVAFDEEQWFGEIADLARERGLLARATYSCVTDGSKQLLQLMDLVIVAGPRAMDSPSPTR